MRSNGYRYYGGGRRSGRSLYRLPDARFAAQYSIDRATVPVYRKPQIAGGTSQPGRGSKRNSAGTYCADDRRANRPRYAGTTPADGPAISRARSFGASANEGGTVL